VLVIDVPHVFRVFGGPRGLLSSLDQHQPDHGTNYNAVQMWLQRGNIPSKWIGAILYCCEQEGHECFEFLTDPRELY
jgi:hypothetical protein